MGTAVDLGIEMIRAVHTGADTYPKGRIYRVPDEVSRHDAMQRVENGVAKWVISERFAMMAATENAARRTKTLRTSTAE